MADLSEAHLAIHLGVPAARNIENVARRRLLLDLHFHAAAGFPERLAIDEGLHGRLASNLRRKLLGLLDRGTAHGIGNSIMRDLDAVARLERVVHMLQDGGLDTTTL